MILSGPISPKSRIPYAKLRNRKGKKKKKVDSWMLWFDGQTDIWVIYPEAQRKCSKDLTILSHTQVIMMQYNSGEREPQFWRGMMDYSHSCLPLF